MAAAAYGSAFLAGGAPAWAAPLLGVAAVAMMTATAPARGGAPGQRRSGRSARERRARACLRDGRRLDDPRHRSARAPPLPRTARRSGAPSLRDRPGTGRGGPAALRPDLPPGGRCPRTICALCALRPAGQRRRRWTPRRSGREPRSAGAAPGRRAAGVRRSYRRGCGGGVRRRGGRHRALGGAPDPHRRGLLRGRARRRTARAHPGHAGVQHLRLRLHRRAGTRVRARSGRGLDHPAGRHHGRAGSVGAGQAAAPARRGAPDAHRPGRAGRALSVAAGAGARRSRHASGDRRIYGRQRARARRRDRRRLRGGTGVGDLDRRGGRGRLLRDRRQPERRLRGRATGHHDGRRVHDGLPLCGGDRGPDWPGCRAPSSRPIRPSSTRGAICHRWARPRSSSCSDWACSGSRTCCTSSTCSRIRCA